MSNLNGFFTDLAQAIFGAGTMQPATMITAAGGLATDKLPGSSATPAQILYPQASYPTPPAPPAVTAVSAGTSTTPAPYTTTEYNRALAERIAQQEAEWNASNRDFYARTFPADIGTPESYLPKLPDLGGLAPWILAAGAAGVLLVVYVAVKR